MDAEADGLYLALGIAASKIPPPSQLRFCPTCFREMRQERGDAWWRRIHQLPGIVVCAIHGEPLRNSAVDRARRGRHALVAADSRVCREDSELAWPADYSSKTGERLLELAGAARRLLVAPPAPLEPVELYLRYERNLANCGLRRGTRHVRYAALVALVRDYWGEALQVVPSLDLEGPRGEAWILDQVRNRRKLTHPLRHLILDLALADAAPVDQPFGLGPWPCLNPIGGHFRQPVIGSHRQVRDKGKLHGHFSCECGYSYSITRQVDGSVGEPRFRSFGPSLRPFLDRAIRDGRSLRSIATERATRQGYYATVCDEHAGKMQVVHRDPIVAAFHFGADGLTEVKRDPLD